MRIQKKNRVNKTIRSACSHFKKKIVYFFVSENCSVDDIEWKFVEFILNSYFTYIPQVGIKLSENTLVGGRKKITQVIFTLPKHMMCSMPKSETDNTHTYIHNSDTFAFTELLHSYGAISWVYNHFLLP